MKTIWLAILLLFMPGLVVAQQNSKERRIWGYGYFTVGGISNGGTSSLIGGGGGAEGLVHKGVGLGADFGVFAHNGFGGIGLFSVNGTYHFINSQSSPKAVPFVTGGYSVIGLSEPGSNGGNAGAGVNYWLRERLGLRLEFRAHFFPNAFNDALYQFRVGIVGR
jgi:hypothetical protein